MENKINQIEYINKLELENKQYKQQIIELYRELFKIQVQVDFLNIKLMKLKNDNC